MDMQQHAMAAWNWPPIVVLLGAVLLLGAYFYAIGPLRRRIHPEEPVKSGQTTAFSIGVGLILLSLVTPLDEYAHMFFTGHMVQHLLLSLAAAPLLLLGVPVWLLQYLLRRPLVRKGWRWLIFPIVASLLFNANLWIWHAPPILSAMMMNMGLRLLSQILFVVTGLLFWWPLLSPELEGLPSLNIAGKMIYMLLSDMPMVLLGAGLTFMPPFYSIFQAAEQAAGISPTVDQQLGGLIMWIPGSIYFIVVASILFLQWMMRQEAKQQAEEIERGEIEEAQVDLEPSLGEM